MEETPQRRDGKIIERDIDKEMRTAYIDYAMSVIVSRALPDARDGLKPVHMLCMKTELHQINHIVNVLIP